MSDDELVLSGLALRLAVRAAENPVTGVAAKVNLARQLRLDEVFELDLREWNPEPVATPVLSEDEDE